MFWRFGFLRFWTDSGCAFVMLSCRRKGPDHAWCMFAESPCVRLSLLFFLVK